MMIYKKETVKKRMEKILNFTKKNQKELAEMCDILPNDISKAISKGDLSVSKAMKISHATGFSLDYIYGNTTITNIPHATLSIIVNHIRPRRIKVKFNEKYFWVNSVDLSPAIEKYFNSIYKVQENIDIIGNFSTDIQKNIENEFLQAIQTNDNISNGRTYVLLPDEFIEETKLYEKFEPVKSDEINTNNEVFDKFIDVPDLPDFSKPHDI